MTDHSRIKFPLVWSEYATRGCDPRAVAVQSAFRQAAGEPGGWFVVDIPFDCRGPVPLPKNRLVGQNTVRQASFRFVTIAPVALESFLGSPENELVHQGCFAARAQSFREITEYIEIFFNRIRKQARLGCLSPAAFGQQYYAKQTGA